MHVISEADSHGPRDGVRIDALFVNSSSSFRNAQATPFESTYITKVAAIDKSTRSIPGDNSWLGLAVDRRCSKSPITKRTRTMNSGSGLEQLAHQIASQVANRPSDQGGKPSMSALNNGEAEKTSGLNTKDPTSTGGQRTPLAPRLLNTGLQYGAPHNNSTTLPPPPAQPPVNPAARTYAGVAASTHGAGRRMQDTRARNAESWRLARERRERYLRTVTRSEECINKNRERFDKINEVATDPYPEHKQNVTPTEVHHQEVRDMFQFLKQWHQATPGKKIVRAEVSHQELINRNEYLRARSFVLYTVDISPSRKAILDWAQVILHQQFDINVERVRVLNRHCYLITVDDEEDRDWILAATPLYLGPHMVFPLPWDVTFNAANLSSCKVPVWVELPNIHPSLEGFGALLLKNVGEVLYTTCEETECRFTNIKGCLRMDLSEELPDSLEIVDPDTGDSYLHPILYRSLPDACFNCHQRGHVVRSCPARRQRRNTQESNSITTTSEAQQATTEGFKPVGNQKGKMDTEKEPKRKRDAQQPPGGTVEIVASPTSVSSPGNSLKDGTNAQAPKDNTPRAKGNATKNKQRLAKAGVSGSQKGNHS
ncbi:hypothetical protein R1sor_015142 [Riccia sorocarpa]|uniref:CCHC-type domain-containing protein n=1 Tax=Riccia sorocarpa TaxID=122646 RepID=A0ABD3HBF8_9MARC